MNKVILCGNVGSDPKTGSTSGGTAWAQVSLATNEKWRDKQGELQEKTSWHRLKFWGRQAEVVEKYISKGSRILVDGRIEYSEYENRDGATVKSTEIVVSRLELLDSRPSQEKPREDDDVPF